MPSFYPDDCYLYLALPLLAFLAASGIRLAFHDLLALTKLDPYGYAPQAPASDGPAVKKAEDSISLPNLRALTTSPNADIARSATALLVSRVKRSPEVMASIRADLRSHDQAVRRRATIGMDFLRHGGEAPFAAPYTPPTRYSPVAPESPDQALLPADDFGEGVAWPGVYSGAAAWEAAIPRPADRTPGERFDAWQIARRRGGSAETGDEAYQDMSLGGRRARDRSELTENPWVIGEQEEREGDVVPSIENPVAGWTDVPRARGIARRAVGELEGGSADAIDDEIARRRRRREAMVLHEGGGRVVEGDIIRARE